MRAAPPSAFLHPQLWAAIKRGASQVLPAILDDDEETGSNSCDAPDSSGPVLELLTSSGDEQWSVGNEICPESGDQSFLELNSVSPVGRYSSPGLRGAADAASLLCGSSGTQDYVEPQEADSGPSQPGKQRRSELQPQQLRLIPVLQAASDSNTKPPQVSKRASSSQRLVTLVADGKRAAAAASGGTSYGRPEPDVLRRAPSPETSPAPTPGRQPAAMPPGQYTNLPPYDQLPQYGLQQQRQQQPSLQQREQQKFVGRIRSVSFAGSSLPPPPGGMRAIGLPPPSPPPPLGFEGFSAAAAAAAAAAAVATAGSENISTPRFSMSSVREHRAAGQHPPHSASPKLQHHERQQQQPPVQQQQQPQLPLQPQPQPPPPPHLRPFAAPRLRTTSKRQIRLTPNGPMPPPPITSSDGIHVQQLLLPNAAATAGDGDGGAERACAWPLAVASPPATPMLELPPPSPTLQLQQQQQQQQLPNPYRVTANDSGQRSPGFSQQQQQQHHHLQNVMSALSLRPPDAAADTVSTPPPPPRQGLSGRPVGALAPAGRTRAARQSAPALGRALQLPDLRSCGSAGGGGGGGNGAASARPATGGGALDETHMSSVGILAAAGAGGPAAVEVPAAPEVAVRPPRWLKPSAFQVTEQLRSGRLQELVDKLATVNCPTFFDLGGCEFSGFFTPIGPVTGLDSGGGATQCHDFAAVAAAAAAAAATTAASVLGAVRTSTPPQRHQTLRASLSDTGNMTARKKYLRHIPETHLQVLSIPSGLHITLYNATLLLTADQHILVGPGASLTLKSVEVLGCSREAARQSAAVRRRAQSMAAAAAAASASPSVQAAATAAVMAAVTSTAATGYSKLVRRSSSPGRTTREAGMYGVGSTGRRVSATDGSADGTGSASGGGVGGGGGGGAGPGLPPVRRRAASTMGGSPFVLSVPIPGHGATAIAVQELVDPNEYVDNHGLIEVVGGYTRISNSRLWPGRCQMALCVSDGGGCSLSYSSAGACCAAGAKSCLVSEQTTYDGGAAGCVSVLHGARLGLTDCILRYPDGGMPLPPSAAAAAEAAVASAAATGGCELGIEARGLGTLAVLTNCDVMNGGVAAALAARLYLQSTRVSDARGHGLLACDPGTTLYVRDCRVDDSGRSAVVACGGAAVRITDATLAGSAASGVLVLPSYDAANATEAVQPTPAMAAAAVLSPPPTRSTLTLLRCDVSANAGHGVWVAGGGFLAVGDSVLYNNLGCGMAADGDGSVLSAADTRLIRNESHGVRTADGAGAVLSRCCATGNGRDGVAVEGAGSRGHLARCECRENRESGLCVTGSASVGLSYTRLAANQHDGLAVGGTGSVATAHGCVLNGNVAKGAVVCMGGAAELSECAIHCNGSKSVQVSDEDSRLVLGRTCTLDRQAVATNGGSLVQL